MPKLRSWTAMAGDLRLHGLQEDVLKGILLGVEAADLHLPLGGDTIELANLHPFGQHELEALLAVDRHLAAEGFDGGGEGGLVAPRTSSWRNLRFASRSASRLQ